MLFEGAQTRPWGRLGFWFLKPNRPFGVFQFLVSLSLSLFVFFFSKRNRPQVSPCLFFSLKKVRWVRFISFSLCFKHISGRAVGAEKEKRTWGRLGFDFENLTDLRSLLVFFCCFLLFFLLFFPFFFSFSFFQNLTELRSLSFPFFFVSFCIFPFFVPFFFFLLFSRFFFFFFCVSFFSCFFFSKPNRPQVSPCLFGLKKVRGGSVHKLFLML